MIEDTEQRLNLLVAYPYMKPDLAAFLREHAAEIRLVVDSGAFTAWKSGKAIALDDYCRFLERTPVRPWRYFTLDVIGEATATDRQDREMRRRGFAPVPIFTRGEDPQRLDEMYGHSDVVAIGGLVGTRGNTGFVNGIMRHVAGRKVHWLGFTKAAFLKHHRPYMADSATWAMGPRVRIVYLYLGGCVVRQFDRKDFAAGLPWAARNALRRYGIDPAAARGELAWKRSSRLISEAGLFASVDMSLDAHRMIGSHVFVSVGKVQEAEIALRAFRTLRRAAPIERADAAGVECQA